MKRVTITLTSLAPYYQSRMHHEPKLEKEDPQAYEERTWREKCTVNADGNICIPAAAFKQAFDRAAKMLSIQIPNRGKATYTKHFMAGIMVPANVVLRTKKNGGIKKSEVDRIPVNCNADGVRGSGKRVLRFFPEIKEWTGELEVIIVDETITQQVFEKHVREAGLLVGVGQNRPENGGSSGRFEPQKFTWSSVG
jgi:hypothetical protein